MYVLFVHYLDFWISSDRILSEYNEKLHDFQWVFCATVMKPDHCNISPPNTKDSASSLTSCFHSFPPGEMAVKEEPYDFHCLLSTAREMKKFPTKITDDRVGEPRYDWCLDKNSAVKMHLPRNDCSRNPLYNQKCERNKTGICSLDVRMNCSVGEPDVTSGCTMKAEDINKAGVSNGRQSFADLINYVTALNPGDFSITILGLQ